MSSIKRRENVKEVPAIWRALGGCSAELQLSLASGTHGHAEHPEDLRGRIGDVRAGSPWPASDQRRCVLTSPYISYTPLHCYPALRKLVYTPAMSLVFPPGTTQDLFTNYKPSTNAHVDFLSEGSASGSGSSQKDGVKTVKLALRGELSSIDTAESRAHPAVRPLQPTSKELLDTLLPAIPLILSGKPTASSFHALSSACHRLVLPPHSLGPTIYTKVSEELEKSAQGLAREWRGSIMSREAGWLERLSQGWKDWESKVVSCL